MYIIEHTHLHSRAQSKQKQGQLYLYSQRVYLYMYGIMLYFIARASRCRLGLAANAHERILKNRFRNISRIKLSRICRTPRATPKHFLRAGVTREISRDEYEERRPTIEVSVLGPRRIRDLITPQFTHTQHKPDECECTCESARVLKKKRCVCVWRREKRCANRAARLWKAISGGLMMCDICVNHTTLTA